MNSIRIGTGTQIGRHFEFEGDVAIGQNVTIGNGSAVRGNIYIGDNCKIKHHVEITGTGYILEGSEILHDIHNPKIGKDCVINGRVSDSTISDKCIVGENAEVERCFLGIGVKAKHYSGLRDAEIGNNTNISEGVTIANYNGVEKQKTKIGAHTMIGVHVRIMGGVEIGDECFVADGARVCRNLPPATYFNPEKALTHSGFGAVRSNCSWYLYGNFLVLEKAVGHKYRAEFVNRLNQKYGADTNAIKEWLRTPIQKMGGRTPIQCIKDEGCRALEDLLPEDAKKQETDQKTEAVRKLIEAAKDKVKDPENWINSEIPTGPLYGKTPKEMVEMFGEKLIPVLLKFAENKAMI